MMEAEDTKPKLSIKPNAIPPQNQFQNHAPSFQPSDLVSVQCDYFDNNNRLRHRTAVGIVRKIVYNRVVKGRDCSEALHVVELSSDNEEIGFLKWDSRVGPDEIPDFEYDRIRMICPSYEKLSVKQKNVVDTLRSHIRMRNDSEPTKLDSEFDELLLGEDGIAYALRKLASKRAPNELISIVSGEKQKDVAVYLSYLLARVVAAELFSSVESAVEVSDIESRGSRILKALESDMNSSPRDRIQSIECPMLSVFLLTLITSCYRDSDQKGTFRPSVLFTKGNEHQFDKVVSKIESIMAIITESIYGNNSNAIIGSVAKGMIRGIRLKLEANGGASDDILKSLHDEGITWGPSMIRNAIDDAVAAIPMGNCRHNTPTDQVDVVVHTLDNCDSMLWRGPVNSIVTATIKIAQLPNWVHSTFVQYFRNGFAHFFDGLGSKLMPNAADDRQVKRLVHAQNIQALYMAFLLLQQEGKSKDEDKIEKDPTFTSESVPGTNDGGGRHRIPFATTVHTSLIENVSSKKADTTRKVLEKISSVTPGFMTEPQVITSDQEFILPLFKTFFLALAASAAGALSYQVGGVSVACGLAATALPLIIVMGNGHANKNVASSIFKYHRKWLYEPTLAQMGYSPGSSSYAKIEKVTFIRKGLQTIVAINESLRISLVKDYLRWHGDEKRIRVSGRLYCPMELIGRWIAQINNENQRLPSDYSSEVVLTPMNRPSTIMVTDEMIEVSIDIMKEARGLENDPNRSNLFGPSGFFLGRDDRYLTPENELFSSLEIDERYANVYAMHWRTRHGELGLVEHCKEAGIYDNAPVKTRAALAQRLYNYRAAGGGEAGIEAAKNCVGHEDRYTRPSPPKNVNIHAKFVNDLLFGAEGVALILSLLVSRVRFDENPFEEPTIPRDRCDACNSTDNCRCSHQHPYILSAKVLRQSCYMRHQQHYQLISTYVCILAYLVLYHACSLCKRVILSLMRDCAAVSRSGDNWKCESAEMAQETTSIQPNKRTNAKKPGQSQSGHKRIKLKSYLSMRRDELTERSNPPIGHKRHLSLAERKAELNVLQTAICATDSVLEKVIAAKDAVDPNKFIIGTTMPLGDFNGLYYRRLNAWQKSHESAIAIVQGLKNGLIIKAPPYPLAIPNSVAAPPKKEGGLKKKVASEAERLMRIFRATGSLAFGPDASTLTERRPVHLFKHESVANDWIHESKYLICVIDGLKDLQDIPAERPGGEAEMLTVLELARRILYWITRRYARAGLSMITVFWDVEATSPPERDIQRKKREKSQMYLGYIAAMNSGDFGTKIEALGSWQFLRDHVKDTFLPFLSTAIRHAMENVDDQANWNFPALLPKGVSLAFVGGIKEKMRHVYSPGQSHSVALSAQLRISNEQVEAILNDAAYQGEAERMIYYFMDRILNFASDNEETVTVSFDIRSDDTDAVAISAPFVLRQHSKFTAKRKQYQGRVMLRLHNKSSAFAYHLGQLIQERDGRRVLGTPSGDLLVCYFDIIALYHYLENDGNLPDFGEIGHRAVSVLLAVYCFTNTDYVWSRITPKMAIRGLKSVEFKSQVEQLVHLPSDSNFAGVGRVQYSTRGIRKLLVAIIVNQEGTLQVLSQTMSKEMLVDSLSPNRKTIWAFVRGATFIAKELWTAPDLLSVLGHISCAQVTISRWAEQTYQSRPPHGVDSLQNTCYVMPRCASEPWSVKQNACLGRELQHRFLVEGPTEANIASVLDNQYRNISKDLDPIFRERIQFQLG